MARSIELVSLAEVLIVDVDSRPESLLDLQPAEGRLGNRLQFQLLPKSFRLTGLDRYGLGVGFIPGIDNLDLVAAWRERNRPPLMLKLGCRSFVFAVDENSGHGGFHSGSQVSVALGQKLVHQAR